MKTKTILPIAVVAIFLTLAFSPVISATEVKEDTYQVNIAWIENPNDPSTFKIDKVQITAEVYQDFSGILENFGTWMKEARPFADYKLDDTEIAKIKEYITSLRDILKDLSPVIAMLTPEMLTDLLLSGNVLKACVLSVGWGRTFMPFNQYEWGFSGGTPFIRPLTFLMVPGYTGVVKYRPPAGAMGYDKTLGHVVIFQGLQGLWIDGGKLGVNRVFHFGIEFIIGRSRVFTIGGN